MKLIAVSHKGEICLQPIMQTEPLNMYEEYLDAHIILRGRHPAAFPIKVGETIEKDKVELVDQFSYSGEVWNTVGKYMVAEDAPFKRQAYIKVEAPVEQEAKEAVEITDQLSAKYLPVWDKMCEVPTLGEFAVWMEAWQKARMEEIIKEVLERAAENALVQVVNKGNKQVVTGGMEYALYYDDTLLVTPDKQSILNTDFKDLLDQ